MEDFDCRLISSWNSPLWMNKSTRAKVFWIEIIRSWFVAFHPNVVIGFCEYHSRPFARLTTYYLILWIKTCFFFSLHRIIELFESGFASHSEKNKHFYLYLLCFVLFITWLKWLIPMTFCYRSFQFYNNLITHQYLINPIFSNVMVSQLIFGHVEYFGFGYFKFDWIHSRYDQLIYLRYLFNKKRQQHT